MTRVLVCDGSPATRRVLRDLLAGGGLDVVGEAGDGAELLERARRLRPDVITLDVRMTRREGLAALRDLMAELPTPVVVVSSAAGDGGAAAAAALAAGAVDAVAGPAPLRGAAAWAPVGDELVARVAAAAQVRAGALAAAPRPAPPSAGVAARAGAAGGRLVVIATSTGGPRALQAVVQRLPSPLGAGVLIVQHMPPGFTGALARRLDAGAALAVREARDGDEIRPDTALVAPAGRHLEVAAAGRVRLSGAPPVGALRPRADITLESAARRLGDRVLAVVLTGMGDDGTAGAAAVRAAGGRVLAEAESTCVVWGMPRAVAAAGHADAVLPLDAMPSAIAEAAARAR